MASRWALRAAATAVALATASAGLSTFAVAQPDTGAVTNAKADAPTKGEHRQHDFDGPLTKSQEAKKEQALQKVLAGKAEVKEKGGSKVVKLQERHGKSKYVELGREKTDKVFTILVEFGDQIHPTYGGTPGPLHNEIAEPDRSKDNSTDWKADYNQKHFEDLYFGEGESLKTYYEKQSSGRYSVDGEVSDWVKVPYNEARYGSNLCDPCAWNAVQDGLNAWFEAETEKGATTAELKARLAEYDQWDRYDFDGDGNFNEADGYIDHFQVVHAGEDESAGGGAQGEDAIWAHRWYAFGTDSGRTGPEGNKLGGTQIGDTGVWVGDYTIQPENGGLGVFAHEYGHDLGLPDHYDTQGGENSTGFWTLMSSGSWLGTGDGQIGNLPGDMNAWDKLQLGWLDYKLVDSKSTSKTTLGVQSYNTRNDQALIVELPEKEVSTEIFPPAQGEKQWWSGSGDDLRNTLTRDVDLTGKSSAAISFDAWYDIEQDYDYFYVEVSTDGGANYTPIDGTMNGTAIPRDGSGAPALHGTISQYESFEFPLDAYAGKAVKVRFRYATDGGYMLTGLVADNIAITADGSTVFSDDAETEAAGWTSNGFSRVGDKITGLHEQYYIVENRQHVGYDRTLKTGPYNFGWSTTRPDWVEHYAYQTGMLVWKWDTSQADNNVSKHPGAGLILPVDAHPDALRWTDGTLLRNRVQAYDSPFSLKPTRSITLHKAGVPVVVPSLRGVPVFDDTKNDYYDEANPQAGVKISDTNTRIELVKQSKDGSTITVKVGPAVK
ncbi:immune inhibitor A domain-containing protein [Streptomyces sp. MJP52]|uniref:immune inhibitor A domain-containing protein n=1 Tax=Streptomyces sp. MJP52 TaxID=2940555 RepID=UPI002475584F|nr:immune inhibitor A domain-containing protein [Streptomyces sp. MJP52]MDH6226725.1 immune inhibitor A [Streptomyces sp. MJP52]